jgi:deazaflavin-dependent oxidoreductase (nitroreductase family)
MSDMNEWNRQIIAEFKANDGVVGGDLAGVPLLLLHHTGAKSGTERVNPLAYQRIGNSVAVFASKGGAPTNPDWYYNLVANPDVTVEIGTETHGATARVAGDEEREQIWSTQKERFPNFAEYEQTAAPRKIPVVVLDLA